MKAFFEEYGFILISVVVMVALIGLIVGNNEDETDGIVETIGVKAGDMIDTLTDTAFPNNKTEQ